MVTGWRRRLVFALALPTVALAGCQNLPPIPLPGNPFRSAPTPEPSPAAAAPIVIGAPTPTPAFTPFWVKNHRLTELWSHPTDGPGVTSFGTTSAQFCSFQVVQPPNGPRLYVFNPYTGNYAWIDADAVGPVPDPPERRSEPRPPNQNCAEAIYEG
ncbi:MAG: hypothetical protein M3O34_20100 [Chloroflexota bacterium]|nr:hypothetical protein [Chloroflexota bacterium]